MKGGLETLPGQTDSRALHLAALASLIAGALSLGFAGLVPAPVCLLSLVLIVVIGLVLPQWMPTLVSEGPHRTSTALAVLVLLIAATALSGPGALFSGQLSGTLSTAVAELALPSGVPIGMLAALAAGALVAVALELGERRGVQSALVLGIAVLGLASVAAPGAHLLLGIVLGWPATLFALSQLAGTLTAASIKTRLIGSPPDTVQLQMMRRTLPPSSPSGAIRRPRRVSARWQLLPVLTAVTLSLSVLTVLLLTNVATIGESGRGWDGAAAPTPEADSRSTAGYLGGEMDMDARGNLGSQPVLKVTDSSPGLWRAGTLDEYTGRGWLTSAPRVRPPKLLLDGRGTATVTPAPASSVGEVRTDQVRAVRSGSPQVLAPGQLISLTSTLLTADGASPIVFPGDRVALGMRTNIFSDYSVRSRIAPRVDDSSAASLLTADPPVNGTQASGAGQMVDEELDPRWKALPESVPSRVRLLGERLVSQAPYRLAAVQAIEAELARRMTYSLDSPVPPPTVDAVDDVLFVSHSGFCEQFASAEVVLLRAAGVPARMAVGFSGGESGDDGFRTLRRSDAHAWVEVWFPGVGWVTSDPTPAAAAVTKSWWQRAQDQLKSVFTQKSLFTPPGVWVLLGIAVLALIATAVLLAWRRRARTRIEEAPLQALDPDLAAAFTRLEADLRAEGRPRAPSETVAVLARRLAQKSDQHSAAGTPDDDQSPDPALLQAMQVLERALYGSRPPSRQECLDAADTIDHVGGRVPARSR